MSALVFYLYRVTQKCITVSFTDMAENNSGIWESGPGAENTTSSMDSWEAWAIAAETPPPGFEVNPAIPMLMVDVPVAIFDDWVLSPPVPPIEPRPVIYDAEPMEATPAVPTLMDDIPDALFDDWLLSPSPSTVSRPVLYDAIAIEKKRLAALKRRHEKDEQRKDEALRRAIDERPHVYDAVAIERKRQAALKIRAERCKRRIVTLQRRATPPRTVRIMPPRTSPPPPSPSWDMTDPEIDAYIWAIHEATFQPTPLPPPVPPQPASARPLLPIQQQPGCFYAEDDQQPSTSGQGRTSSVLQPPIPPSLDIPRQPGCYYAEDNQQPSTSRHQNAPSPLKEHYSPEDFQADPDASFREVLMRMLDSVQDRSGGMDNNESHELEWMDDLLKNIDSAVQQSGQAEPATTQEGGGQAESEDNAEEAQTQLSPPPGTPPRPPSPVQLLDTPAKRTFNPQEHYALHDGVVGYSIKFLTETQAYNIEFRDLGKMSAPDYYVNITQVLDAAIQDVARGMQPNDMIRFYMNSEAWKNAINMPYMQVNELTGQRVLQEFMKTDQSNGNTGLEGQGVVMDIVRTIMPRPGAGCSMYGSCRKRIFLELVSWLDAKRCSIDINNQDQMCLARSIVVAIAHWQYANQASNTPEEKAQKKALLAEKKRIQNGQRDYQRVKALELCHRANVDPNRPCGIPEAALFQDILQHSGYRLMIYSAEANFETTFVGPETCVKPLPVLHYDHHYVVLTSLTAFFNVSYFCWNCLKGYYYYYYSH